MMRRIDTNTCKERRLLESPGVVVRCAYRHWRLRSFQIFLAIVQKKWTLRGGWPQRVTNKVFENPTSWTCAHNHLRSVYAVMPLRGFIYSHCTLSGPFPWHTPRSHAGFTGGPRREKKHAGAIGWHIRALYTAQCHSEHPSAASVTCRDFSIAKSS